MDVTESMIVVVENVDCNFFMTYPFVMRKLAIVL